MRDLLRDGPLPIPKVLDCAAQVAEALAAAHREGVVHRDLKPENVMAADSGYYKVLDFGVARREGAAPADGQSPTQMATLSSATREGVLIGTLSYMSPEQVLGKTVDTRSDIFSFGSLVYELTTGRPAFRGGNEIATAHAIAYESPEPMSELRPDSPVGLEDVVHRCLEKKPDQRYSDARDLADDLRALRNNSLSGTSSGSRLLALRQRRPSPWRWVVGVAVSAAIIAVAALVGPRLVERGGTESAPPHPAPAAAGKVLPASDRGVPRVVVAFFENNSGDPEADWLSRGLPEMLTTDLSRSEGLEVIATQRIYDLLALSGRERGEKLDQATTTELARWAGADVVVSGSIFKLGETYRIDAQAFDIATGAVTVARKVEGTDLFQMVNELTAGLRHGLQVAEETEDPRLQLVTTSSPEAFRRYARGKTLYESLAFPEAAEHLRASLDLDPAFTLARMRLGLTLIAEGDRDRGLEYLDEALAEADKLPEAERLLARGVEAAYREGDPAGGREYFDELVRRYPGAKEAYVWWATISGDLGGDALEATRKLREALARDPNYLPAVAAMAGQLAGIGDEDSARAILEDARMRNPEAAEAVDRILERWAETEPGG
jgi:TolB-like protein